MPSVEEKMQNFNIKKIVGFNGNVETLPEFFDEFNSKEKLRQMFLNLTNTIVGDIYQFTKYEQKSLSTYKLKSIYAYKIKSMLPTSCIKRFKQQKSFKLDINSTLVINNYLLKENKTILFSNKKLLPVAKLISFCFVNNKMQLNFDIDLLFHQFVFNKIKKLHKNKNVLDNGNSISILSQTDMPIKIYTQWKSINSKNLNIKNELDNAIECIKQSEFKQVYLVYPKDSDFKRHIPIKVEELEKTTYDIKVIPYSLRSTIRKNKG